MADGYAYEVCRATRLELWQRLWGQVKRAGSSHTPEMVTMVLTAEVAIAVTLGSFRFCVVVISTLAYAKG